MVVQGPQLHRVRFSGAPHRYTPPGLWRALGSVPTSPRRKTTAPLIDRLTARRSRLPHPTAWEKETVRIPLRDGERLAADVYTPTVRSKGVLLVRTPYGRGIAMGLGFARVWAGQGYTVVYVATRGTNGSTGTFDPMRTETTDGHDVVAWLREQPWYPGTLATFGHSYLGYTRRRISWPRSSWRGRMISAAMPGAPDPSTTTSSVGRRWSG